MVEIRKKTFSKDVCLFACFLLHFPFPFFFLFYNVINLLPIKKGNAGDYFAIMQLNKLRCAPIYKFFSRKKSAISIGIKANRKVY